jgi:4-amino-4-deoxy-L-arabinose transferase-like glycosyltransferase
MNSFQKYLLLSLIIALLNAALILIFFAPRFDYTDTPQYISTIRNLAGDETAQVYPFRILKPMPILIGAALAPFVGAENTLVFQNIFFYFFSVVLIYFLINFLYHNPRQAFYGAVLYSTAYPMLAYGLASLTDLSGWFFFLLAALLSLIFLKKPSLKTAIFAGLVAGMGMLFKENVAAAPIFFASLVFIAGRFPLKEKLKYILVFGLAFILFPVANSIILYKIFSYSHLDTFRTVGVGGSGARGNLYMYTLPRILIEMGRVFLLGWVFIFLGAYKEFSQKGKERIRILLSFIPPSLSPFLWIAPHNRMLFIAFPILVLLGSFGLLRNLKDPRISLLVELGLLFLYIILNYAILEFLLNYGIYFWRFGDLSNPGL